MKTCTKCNALKPLDQFYAKKAECKACTNERVRACRQRKKLVRELQTEYDRFRAKVMDHLEKADRNANLVDLVSGLTAELIAFVAAPAPAAEPVVAETQAYYSATFEDPNTLEVGMTRRLDRLVQQQEELLAILRRRAA